MGKIMRRQRCHDCNVQEGDFHVPGCDMERCPFCYGQLISCDCCYEKLGLIDYDAYPETSGLSPEIYEGGLTEELNQKWDKILREQGLIPYIQSPVLCGKCGALWPDFFSVDDGDWKKYINGMKRHLVICRPCYDSIVSDVENSVDIVYPDICGKCGKIGFEKFEIDRVEDYKHIWSSHNNFDLCHDCYNTVMKWVDNAASKRQREECGSKKN